MITELDKYLWIPAVFVFLGIIITFMIGLAFEQYYIALLGGIILISSSIFIGIHWNRYYRSVPDGSEYEIQFPKVDKQ